MIGMTSSKSITEYDNFSEIEPKSSEGGSNSSFRGVSSDPATCTSQKNY